MGGNMVLRLHQKQISVAGFDQNETAVSHLVEQGVPAERLTHDMDTFMSLLGEAGQRVVWLMVPAGNITETVMKDVASRLSKGDIIIDGGNSNFHDTVRRGAELAEQGIYLVDVGTSGGVWGITEGYGLMAGGERAAIERLKPILEALAPSPERGWGHVGPVGAGHYVKMVHNGIEYGMMQAYAEGFELMKAHKTFDLDMAQIAEIWRHGTVIRSWLLDLTAEALQNSADFDSLSDYVADSGEGRWTIIDSIELGVPTPVITLATQMRFRSQQEVSYAGQMLSAMRRAFGGHAVKTIEVSKQEGLVPEVAVGSHPKEAAPENIQSDKMVEQRGKDKSEQLGELQ